MIRTARVGTFAEYAAGCGLAYRELCRPEPLPLSIPLLGGGAEIVEASSPLVFAAELDDVLVFGRNGFVLTGDDWLLPYGISFRNYALADDLGRHAVRLEGGRATLRLSDDTVEIDEEVVLFGGSENFAHFLHQFMGRLAVADLAGALAGRKVLVYRQVPARFLEMLRLAGVADADMVFADREATIRCRKAVVPSACIYRGLWNDTRLCAWPRGLAWLRGAGGRAMRAPAGRRLYLTRADCPWRKPSNEEEVAETLERYGFVTTLAAGLGLRDQIALASEAEAIVVPLGAGSWLSLFAPEGAAIIELAPPGIAGTVAGRLISAVFGMRYRRLVGTPVEFAPAELASLRGYWFDPARDRNYEVDTAELEAVLAFL